MVLQYQGFGSLRNCDYKPQYKTTGLTKEKKILRKASYKRYIQLVASKNSFPHSSRVSEGYMYAALPLHVQRSFFQDLSTGPPGHSLQSYILTLVPRLALIQQKIAKITKCTYFLTHFKWK